jgi:hypothetical protein
MVAGQRLLFVPPDKRREVAQHPDPHEPGYLVRARKEYLDK